MCELPTINLGDLLVEPPNYGANVPATPILKGWPRYIRITDILETGDLIPEGIKGIEPKNAQPYLLKEGDILIARSGNTVGKAYIHRDVGLQAAHAGYLIRFRVDKNKADPNFIFHFLHSGKYWSWVKSASKVAAQPNINAKQYSCLPIPDIHPSAQKAIATILDTLDTAIQQTQALIAKLKQVKAGMLHDLLTCGLDGNGELRDPSRNPDQFKNSVLGRIPKDWEVRLLSQVADISSGVTLGKNIQGSGTINLPYLRVANVQDGFIDLSDVKKVCIYKKDMERYSLHKGDVLMNEGGDFDKLGRGAVWEGQINPCLHQNHVFRVRPIPNLLNSYYLDAVSGSQYGKQYFILISKQSTNLASINSTQLKNFPIPYPPLKEQESIAAILFEQEKAIQIEVSVLEKSKQLKQALMKDLLTGKVRVPENMMEAMP